MIKCVVFDVDGTLYDFKSNGILPSTIQAINQLKQKDILFVIASGRANYALGSALNDLKPDYVIGMNGAMITKGLSEVLTKNTFSKEQFERVCAFCEEYDGALLWKFEDKMHIYKHPEKVDWLAAQLESDIGKEPFVFDDTNRHFLSMPISCCVHVEPMIIEQTFANDDELSLEQYSKDGYDVVLKGMSKGAGLQTFMELTKIKPEEIVVFGDNYNDLSMMKIAGYKVAMGNAIDEVKTIADYVTTSCSDDGIYNGLQYLKLI